MSIDYKPRFGRPSTSGTDKNVDKVWAIVFEDQQQTTEIIVWPNLWQTRTVFFQHDKAPAHAALLLISVLVLD